jgi:hypothetical protein
MPLVGLIEDDGPMLFDGLCVELVLGSVLNLLLVEVMLMKLAFPASVKILMVLLDDRNLVAFLGQTPSKWQHFVPNRQNQRFHGVLPQDKKQLLLASQLFPKLL